MFQLLTKGMGNSIPTIGANNRQEPSVDGPILFQDQRRQSATAQTNLGFNTVSQNATNVPGASSQRAAPNSARSTTTSNVENTVKSIATDVQKLEGLEDVEETLERMDEKLGRLVKAEESEEKARKSKKRQEELPKNVSGSDLSSRFKDSGIGNRVGQLAGAAGGAVAGMGLMAMLFGPGLVKDLKKQGEENLDEWNNFFDGLKEKADNFFGTGDRIQEATDEEQIAAKLALQSGAAGKALTTATDIVTSRPVAQAAVGAAGLAAKGTGFLAAKGTQVTASAIDAATTAINQAGQTTTKDSRGRELTRNKTTGRLEQKAKGTELRKTVDTLADKAKAAKAAVANNPVAKVVGKGAGMAGKATVNASAAIAKAIAQNGSKLVAKVLPGVGAAIGGGMSINKMIEGDYYGAAAAGAGAILSFVPGVGTAGAVAIGAYEMAREIYNNLYEQYPEDDPDAGERWPLVLDETKEAVVKYVDDFFNKDKEVLSKAKDSGLYDKDWIGDSEINLDKAQTATTGELEAILRDDDLSDEDTASVQAILKKRAEAVDQGNPLLVAPGSAADFEADQAAMDIAASTSWQREGKIGATKMKSATEQVEDLAMAEAGANQPNVTVQAPNVNVPKQDAPNVSVSVNVGDQMLHKDLYSRIGQTVFA